MASDHQHACNTFNKILSAPSVPHSATQSAMLLHPRGDRCPYEYRVMYDSHIYCILYALVTVSIRHNSLC
eukprot:scaffold248186_cov19-Prasinocladus_malaysianus.AAC.1